jgi:hypothetical protein
MTVESSSFPVGSTYGAIAMGAFFERRLPTSESIAQLKLFTRVSLMEVDNDGDRRNYPVVKRTLAETIRNYHPDIEVGEADLALSVGRKIEKWLGEKGIVIPEAKEWFEANITWEHIMGGGDVRDIPKEWQKKYLRTEINGVNLGYPVESTVRQWEGYEREEQILIYRLVTNKWFTEAVCACLKIGNVDQLTGAVMIYQVNSDCKNKKNKDEPVISEAVNLISQRCRHSPREEIGHIGRITGLNPVLVKVIDAATWTLTRMTKRPDWEAD